MFASLWAVFSLLLSIGILLFGHGMQLTLLPLLGEAHGFTALVNALTTSAYFLGFAAGCVLVPLGLRSLGHIRVFTVLVAVATSALLALGLWSSPWAWFPLRAVYGVAIAGIYLVIESWLNAATARAYRGTVLAVYAFVTLVTVFAAQWFLEPARQRHELLMLAAFFLVLAAVPVGITRRPAPAIVAIPRLRLASLLARANWPAFAAGWLTGTFWALAPLYVTRSGHAGPLVAHFMGAVLGGGLLLVYPLGWLSDRIGRARVLVGLGSGGAVATLAFAVAAPSGEYALLAYGIVLGACSMPLYALCMALANDLGESGDFVDTGRRVLMMNALGMVAGPLLAGVLLTRADPARLLWVWCVAFIAVALCGLRLPRPSLPTLDAAHAFELVPRTAPTALELDPRAAEQR